MATGSITSLGIGSGLDLQDILDKLKAADETSITIKENKITTLQGQVDAYNTINAKLFSIKSQALNLSLQSNFMNNSASVSDEDILTATVGDGYSEASYTIEVAQKAQRNSWESTGVESKTDALFTAPESGIADHDTTAVINSDETLRLTYGTYGQISTDDRIATGTTDDTFAINGITIGAVTVLDNDSDGALVAAINDKTNEHGVTASVDENGILTLVPLNHSEINVTMDAGTQTVFGGTGAMSNTGQEQMDISLTAGMTLEQIVDAINDSAVNDDGDGNTLVTASFVLGDNDDYYIRLSATSGGNSADSEISVSGFDWIAADTTVAISQGEATMVVSAAPGTSYEEMAALINDAEDNPGVTAAIIDNGDTDAPFQMTLTANNTGEAARISLSNFAAMTQVTGSGEETLNARFTVDGIAYSRQANTAITDVISGVTLDLKNLGESTLNIEVSHESVKENIVAMVEGFNDLISYVTGTQAEDDTEEDADTESPLDGLTNANRIVYQLKSLLTSVLDLDTDYTSLADIGLDIARNGTISIDEDVLDQAIATDPDAISALFLGDADEDITGIADKINDALSEMVSTTGIASTEIDQAETRITRLDKDIETETERLTRKYDTMSLQFASLDNYISQLNSEASALESLINNFNTSSE